MKKRIQYSENRSRIDIYNHEEYVIGDKMIKRSLLIPAFALMAVCLFILMSGCITSPQDEEGWGEIFNEEDEENWNEIWDSDFVNANNRFTFELYASALTVAA